eukprot:jgi/Botrbrau1/10288/Bobra.0120s0010.1
MGGGNAQKAAMARQRKAEKDKNASKGSQLKANAAAMSLLCQVCRQSFMCTSTRQKLEEHVQSKHEKQGFEACFPGFNGR